MKLSFLLVGFFLLLFGLEGQSEGLKTADPESSQVINNMVGEVTFVKGEVTKVRGDNQNEIKIGAPNQIIQEGDTLVTKTNAFVKVRMVDDSIIAIGPKSKFVFEKFVFRSKEDRRTIYGFVAGKFRAHVPHKAQAGDIMIKTKTTSLGIRGTVFVGNINTMSNGSDATQFAVVEGSVQVKNEISGESKDIAQKEKIVSVTQGKESVDFKLMPLDEEQYAHLASYDDSAKSDNAPTFLVDFDDEGSGREISSLGKPEYDSGPPDRPRSHWLDVQKQLNQRLHEYNAR